MKLPFGKKVPIGGYYVYKHAKSLSAKEVRRLRSEIGIPDDIQKHLQRGSVPYITIGTLSDLWRIEFAIGTSAYNAIDEIPVAVDDAGKHTYYGDGYKILGNLINGWLSYTCTVGDAMYQADVIRSMQNYLGRMSDKPLDGDGKESCKAEALEAMRTAIGNLEGIPADDERFFNGLLALKLDLERKLSRLYVSEDNTKPLPKEENEKALDEAEAYERHRKTLIRMSDYIKKEEGSGD